MTALTRLRAAGPDPLADPAAPEAAVDRFRAGRSAMVAIALIAGFVIAIFTIEQRELVGLTCLAMMLLLIFLKVPVGLALIVPGLLGMGAIVGPRALQDTLMREAFLSTASWSLSVLPMFVFMGLALWRSGLTEKLYVVARAWLRWLPGGLAVCTNTAGAGMSALNGSTAATTYALGRIGIPEMLRAGYDKRLAIGSVILVGLGGNLVPPSILMVLYAGIAGVAVGPQLLAGALPGLFLQVVLFTGMIIGLAVFRPRLAGRGSDAPVDPPVPWGERIRLLGSIWPLFAIIAIVIGGIFYGVFTATEAGALGALVAMLVALWAKRRDRPLQAIRAAVTETVSVCGAIFLMLVGVGVLARLLSASRLGPFFVDWVTGLGLTRVQFLLLMVVAYLIMGMFMTPLPMMLLTVPLLVPVMVELDISLVWFGVFAVFMGEIAAITPPVGILSYIIHGIVRDPEVNRGQTIRLGDIFISVAWFLPICLVFCLVLIFFPGIVTLLPDLMSG